MRCRWDTVPVSCVSILWNSRDAVECRSGINLADVLPDWEFPQTSQEFSTGRYKNFVTSTWPVLFTLPPFEIDRKTQNFENHRGCGGMLPQNMSVFGLATKTSKRTLKLIHVYLNIKIKSSLATVLFGASMRYFFWFQALSFIKSLLYIKKTSRQLAHQLHRSMVSLNIPLDLSCYEIETPSEPMCF